MIKSMLYNMEKYLRCWFEVPSFYKENFILCASFPKSGNTWFRFIVSNISNIYLRYNEEVDFHTIRFFAPEIRGNRDLKNAKFTKYFPFF